MKRKESTWLWVQGALAMCFCFLLVSGIILNGVMLWLVGWFVNYGSIGHAPACMMVVLLAACGIVNLVALIKQARALRGRSAPKEWLSWKYAGVVLNISVLAFWLWAEGYYEVSDLSGGERWLMLVMGVCPVVSLIVLLCGPSSGCARIAGGGRGNSDSR